MHILILNDIKYCGITMLMHMAAFICVRNSEGPNKRRLDFLLKHINAIHQNMFQLIHRLLFTAVAEEVPELKDLIRSNLWAADEIISPQIADPQLDEYNLETLTMVADFNLPLGEEDAFGSAMPFSPLEMLRRCETQHQGIMMLEYQRLFEHLFEVFDNGTTLDVFRQESTDLPHVGVAGRVGRIRLVPIESLTGPADAENNGSDKE